MRKKLVSIIFLSLCLLWTGCGKEVSYNPVVPTDTQVFEGVTRSESVPVSRPIKDASQTVSKPPQSIHGADEVKNITIASVGDIMMHDAQIKSGSLGGGKYDYSMMFKSIKPYIEKADFALGNLETTLSGKGKNYTGYPMFNSPEILAKNIKDAGFDMVTTANNHSLDRRFYGVTKTIENLDKAGLLHTGTYKTEEDSKSIFMEDIKGVKVAFLAYTYATNGITVKEKFAVNLINQGKMLEDIKRGRALNPDMVIVSMHFGVEYQTKQNKTQENLVNFLFKNGVDVVLGSHPHVLQPMEMKSIKDIYGVEKDRFVVYSQGNIVANMPKRYKNSGVIVNLNIRKDKNGTTIDKVEYISTFVDSYYNAKIKKAAFEILPVFSQNDYSSHSHKAIIKQSFNDSIKILRSSSTKIKLMDKK